jgi:hypothetical protein
MGHAPQPFTHPLPGVWDGVADGRRDRPPPAAYPPPGAGLTQSRTTQTTAAAFAALPFAEPSDPESAVSVEKVARRWWEIDPASWPLPHFPPEELRCRAEDALGGGLVYLAPAVGAFLEFLRAETGGRPLTVSSCYRTRAYNDALRRRGYGTAQRSQHMLGRAIDVQVRGRSADALLDAASRFVGPNGERVGGVGTYPRSRVPFIHFDFGPAGRRWGDPFEPGFAGMAEDETGAISEAEADDQAKAGRAIGGVGAGAATGGGLVVTGAAGEQIGPEFVLQLARYGAPTAVALGAAFAAWVYRRELAAWSRRAWSRIAGRLR